MGKAPRAPRKPRGPVESEYPKTPAGNWLRLAEKRTSDIIDTLNRLPPLADRKVYEYEDANVSAMLDTIQTKLDAVREHFANPPTGKKQRTKSFSFGGAAAE